MKLNQEILKEVNKVLDAYYKSLASNYQGEKSNSLSEELYYHVFYTDEDMGYVERGDFLNDFFQIAIKEKDSEMISDAFTFLYRDCGDFYRKDIIDSINSLLLETWHKSQEQAMYTIIMYLQDISSVPYLEKAAAWDDECIEFFKGGFHKDAIRGIFQIAKKDSIKILEGLVEKVDEETAPFLERKIREAKEYY